MPIMYSVTLNSRDAVSMCPGWMAAASCALRTPACPPGWDAGQPPLQTAACTLGWGPVRKHLRQILAKVTL